MISIFILYGYMVTDRVIGNEIKGLGCNRFVTGLVTTAPLGYSFEVHPLSYTITPVDKLIRLLGMTCDYLKAFKR